MADWDGLGPTTNHVAAELTLAENGWTRCGAGDWAIALRSPDGELAARISPFDPTGPMTADLYRHAAHTGRVPWVSYHARLEGGGDLLVMEHLEPAPRAEAEEFLADIAANAPSVGELARIVRSVHAAGVASLPWCGPLDSNPTNIMRRHDGTLVLTDPFYADGPNLYSAALHEPERVARLIPPQDRRYIAEIPYFESGSPPAGEQDQVRDALAAVDAATLNG